MVGTIQFLNLGVNGNQDGSISPHPITIEFASSGGLKARKVIAWAEASQASEAQVESAHET
jgi:hypothetical protein